MRNERDAVIVSAARTPIAKYKGDFANIPVPELGGMALKHVVEKISLDPAEIDQVIMGNLFASDWGNVARVSSGAAGFPKSVPGLTVDHQCSSSLNAVSIAAVMIQSGMMDVVVAGGVESYSQWPLFVRRPNAPFPTALEPLQYKAAIEELVQPLPMIETAENIAEKYHLKRSMCDEFAQRSHLRAVEAWKEDRFHEQVFSVTVQKKKGESKTVCMDACVRPDCTLEGLSALRPVMKKDGVVTAGNSSPLNDGASAVVVMSRKRAAELGLEVLAVVRDFASAGCEPRTMGEGPIYATRKLMDKFGYQISDFDLIELNEAFASQSLACIQALGLDVEKVNIDGGAISIGHPNGASGTMLVGRLIYALRRRNARLGLVSFCCGGGQGFSLVLENPEA